MDLTKLAKVLALASSSNEAEAQSALRRANEMLARGGSSFVELAGMLQNAPAPDNLQKLKLQNLALRRENRRLKRERAEFNDKINDDIATASSPSDWRAALAREIQARRQAEAAHAQAIERVVHLERLWRRASTKRTEMAGELRLARTELAALTAELDKAKLKNKRLTTRVNRLERGTA